MVEDKLTAGVIPPKVGPALPFFSSVAISLLAYIVVLPFTDLSVGIDIFGLTYVAAIAVAVSVWISVWRSSIRVLLRTEDLLFIGMLAVFSASLAYSLSVGTYGPKSLNHHAAKVFVWVVLFYSVRIALEAATTNAKLIRAVEIAIVLSVSVAAVLAIFEFIERNASGGESVLVEQLIPRVNEEIVRYDARFIEVFRTRGFVEESGHFGFFFEALGPLAIALVLSRGNPIVRGAVSAIVVVGYLTTFTVAGIVTLLPVVFIVGLHLRRRALVNLGATVGVMVFVSLGVAMLMGVPLIEFLEDKLSDETLSGRTMNYAQLWERISDFNVMELFIGVGPGAAYTLDMGAGAAGILSLYGIFFAEGGLFTIALLVALFARAYRRIKSIPDERVKVAMSVSVTWCIAHYLAIGNYWYPWMWFVLALIVSGAADKFVAKERDAVALPILRVRLANGD